MQSPFGTFPFEGAFAHPSYPYSPDGGAPYPTVPAGAGSLVAPAGGLIMGRFAWASPDTGIASNAFVSGAAIGIVLPQWGRWGRVYFDNTAGAWRVREGLPVTLCSYGDFWLRFAGGAVVANHVYASTIDGQAVSGNTTDSNPTDWYVARGCSPGGLGLVTQSRIFGD